MPAGCEFICKNKACEHFDSGFSLTAPWPIGQIELVINSSPVKKFNDLRERLITQKNDGIKYALIQFPNVDKIEFLGQRINLWSPKGNKIFQYEVDSKGNLLDKTISAVPKICPDTKCDLLSFNEVLEQGIVCPFCSGKLFQNRWFTNED